MRTTQRDRRSKGYYGNELSVDAVRAAGSDDGGL